MLCVSITGFVLFLLQSNISQYGCDTDLFSFYSTLYLLNNIQISSSSYISGFIFYEHVLISLAQEYTSCNHVINSNQFNNKLPDCTLQPTSSARLSKFLSICTSTWCFAIFSFRQVFSINV